MGWGLISQHDSELDWVFTKHRPLKQPIEDFEPLDVANEWFSFCSWNGNLVAARYRPAFEPTDDDRPGQTMVGGTDVHHVFDCECECHKRLMTAVGRRQRKPRQKTEYTVNVFP